MEDALHIIFFFANNSKSFHPPHVDLALFLAALQLACLMTLLVGHQAEHPACKKLSDEVLV